MLGARKALQTTARPALLLPL
eukprot:COSAG05_NODE_15997_length_356_cov_0.630350_1_plen_20_part_10